MEGHVKAEPFAPRKPADDLYSIYDDETQSAAVRVSAFDLLISRKEWRKELDAEEVRRTMAVARAINEHVLKEQIRLAIEAVTIDGDTAPKPVNYHLAFVRAHGTVWEAEKDAGKREAEAEVARFWKLKEIKVEQRLTRRNWIVWSTIVQRTLAPHRRALGILVRKIPRGHPDYIETIDLQLGALLTPTIDCELHSILLATSEQSYTGSALWQALAEHCQGPQHIHRMSLCHRLDTIGQGKNETLDRYAARFRELLYECKVANYQVEKTRQVSRFCDGLAANETRLSAFDFYRRHPNTDWELVYRDIKGIDQMTKLCDRLDQHR